MLAQITDLRLCALMSLHPYVLVPLCLRPYVLAPFCLLSYVVDHSSNILAVNNNPLKDFP